MTTRVLRSMALPMLLALGLGACTGTPSDPSSPSALPTAAPSTTSVAGIRIDIAALLTCLQEGGIDIEPEDEPRFGANAEVQILAPTADGSQASTGVFIYDSPEDATAGKAELDAELATFDSPPSQQIGNVLVTDIQGLLADASAGETIGVLLNCLT